MSNIEKVDSVTLLRKDKVMNGVSWPARFQQAISTWPYLNDLGSAAAQVSTDMPMTRIFNPLCNQCFFFQDTRCGACERDKSSTMIQMFGQPYNQNTLKSVQPDDQASLNRVKSFISLPAFYNTCLVMTIWVFCFRISRCVRDVAGYALFFTACITRSIECSQPAMKLSSRGERPTPHSTQPRY